MSAQRLVGVDVRTEDVLWVVSDTMHRALEPWETKTLSTFVRDQRVVRLPAQRKRRMVILEWLVGWFELNRPYRENEVNEILADHLGSLVGQEHAAPDVATVRRELVWNRFMDRERSIYHRMAERQRYEEGPE